MILMRIFVEEFLINVLQEIGITVLALVSFAVFALAFFIL